MAVDNHIEAGIFIPFKDSPDKINYALETLTGQGFKGAVLHLPTKGKLKNLPRHENGELCRVFLANGTKYTILSPEEGISLKRWNSYEQMSISFGFNKTFQAIYNFMTKVLHESYKFNDPSLMKDFLAKRIHAFLDGVIEIGEQRYSMAHWMCTLFIVKEGEDLTTYVKEEQEKKLDDWNTEYKVEDFFFVCLTSISGLAEKFLNVQSDLAKKNRELLSQGIATS